MTNGVTSRYEQRAEKRDANTHPLFPSALYILTPLYVYYDVYYVFVQRERERERETRIEQKDRETETSAKDAWKRSKI